MKNQNFIHSSVYLFTIAALFTSISLTGCENSVSGEEQDHPEAEGFQLRIHEEVVADKKPGQTILQQFPDLHTGLRSDTVEVWFYTFDEELFQPVEDELFLSVEAEDTSMLDIDVHTGLWSFTILPEKAGTTTFKLFLLHDDHPDFESVPVTVNIQSVQN